MFVSVVDPGVGSTRRSIVVKTKGGQYKMCIRDSNYTARQLKLPLEIEKLIDISDPVYTFCEVMDHIDLSRYCSLREIEKLCRNDIRYMYLLDEMKAPTFATFGNLIQCNNGSV